MFLKFSKNRYWINETYMPIKVVSVTAEPWESTTNEIAG